MTVYEGEVKILEVLKSQVAEIEREKEKHLTDLAAEFWKKIDAETTFARNKIESDAKDREQKIKVREREILATPVPEDGLKKLEYLAKRIEFARLKESESLVKESESLALRAMAVLLRHKNEPIAKGLLQSAAVDFDRRIKVAQDKASEQRVKVDTAKKRLDTN